ncbi:MAG TPA: YicC/YloC family endoribonuclease [Roseiarcus sp.]|nr:YicC/YloC family endoribonuclease [Roseiarcus sp.]
MPLSSMTGFARVTGAEGPYRWVVELKSVNAKGLDLRLRTPPGFDRIEGEARARLAKALARGACFATISAHREGGVAKAKVNPEALAAVIAAAKEAAQKAELAPPTIDGVLAVRGVVEVDEASEDEDGLAAACEGALKSCDEAIAALVAMRKAEGGALAAILDKRLAAIAGLTKAADDNPGRRPEAVRARLAQSIAVLLDANRGFDENRLHQEAILLAAKADIREELDRLVTHVAAARDLIETGGPVGRRLDFLAQELSREANTLCAKANDAALTTIGLELRSQIEQLREQIQNVE